MRTARGCMFEQHPNALVADVHTWRQLSSLTVPQLSILSSSARMRAYEHSHHPFVRRDKRMQGAEESR